MLKEINLSDIEEFPNLEILAKQIVEGFITGLHKSPFHGFSVEFSEHKAFNVGDNVKNIDWRLYARSGRMYTKKYEEETNLRCHFILDASSSMYFPNEKVNKIRFSIFAIAALTKLFKQQRDAFGLQVITDKIIHSFPAKSNTKHQQTLFQCLQQCLQKPELAAPTNTIQSLHEIAETIPKRGLVILFSDMFQPNLPLDELMFALQHLRFNKHEVVLFHTLDYNYELALNYDSRPHLFIDLETGEKVKLNPQELQNTYKTTSNEWKEALKLKCGQLKIDFVDADIEKGFAQVLLPYLLKRQKLM